MNEIKCNAYAKINLSVDVIGKRSDGYHEVMMVLQQIDLRDKVTVSCRGEGTGTIRIKTDASDLPTDESNIAWKAVKVMKGHCPDHDREDVDIHIEKTIPIAAGLAGGSADAAAVLLGLNALWECGLSVLELMKLGVKLGADVPFCIMGQAAKDPAFALAGEKVSTCALALGIGEVLTPLPPLSAFVVLSKPPISVSTAEIYGCLDLAAVKKRPDTDRVVDGLLSEDFMKIKAGMHNVLEEVSVKRHPVIGERIRMLRSVASGSKIMMSGSGSAVFALTQDEEAANTVYKKINAKCPGAIFVKTSIPILTKSEI